MGKWKGRNGNALRTDKRDENLDHDLRSEDKLVGDEGQSQIVPGDRYQKCELRSVNFSLTLGHCD